jgi:hypothetical protein
MVRDGQNPDLALRAAVTDSIATTDAERGKIVVEICDDYLGRDPNEVARERKTRDPLRTAEQLRRAIFDSPRQETAGQNLMRLADEMGERMRKNQTP